MDDRAAYRNVHVFDASDRERLLGGLNQNGSITEANFLDMLAILLVAHFPIKVQDRFSCHEVRRSESALQPGIYDVTCKGPIALTDEPWLPRLVCPPYTDPAFSDAVLARDGRCALSGAAGSRLTTEAAYIFPCDNEDHWLAHGLAHSPQNGLALAPHVRELWDQCLVAVNPDDGHKVVAFGPDTAALDGRTLAATCRAPSDALLRWHYRQAVLANVRGGGEPLFAGAGRGADALRALQCGPYAKERFQMEVVVRLRGFAGGE